MKVTSVTEIEDDYYLNVTSDAVFNLVFKNGGAFTMAEYYELLTKIGDIYNDNCEIETRRRGYGLCDMTLKVSYRGNETSYSIVVI